MNYELIERVAQATERRRFLANAGAATLGVVAGGLVRSEPAAAFFECHRCTLCNSTSGNCPPGVNCYWCWTGDCHRHGGGSCHRHQCCEGYTPGGNCGTGECPAACSVLGAAYDLGCNGGSCSDRC